MHQVPKPLSDAAAHFQAVMEQASIPFAFVGGFAVALHGAPRLTADVDVIVDGSSTSIESLAAILLANGFVSRAQDLIAFARQTYALVVTHVESGVPLDISIGYSPWEQGAIAIAQGASKFPVVSVDDLIVMKIVAMRSKDQIDVQQLLALNPDIDRRAILKRIEPFAKDLDAPEILDIARALLQ